MIIFEKSNFSNLWWETITESNGTGAGIILQPRIPGPIKKHTGDLLYLNNRGAVARSAGQAEDIKIVIQI